MNRKRLIVFVNITIGLVFVMGIFSYFLLNYVRNGLEQDVKVNLMEITKQNAKVITEQVNQELNSLDMMCELLLNNYESLDDPEIADFLKMKAVEHDVYRFMISKPTGAAITSEAEEADISKRIYFKNTMKGISHISELTISKIDGEEVYIASVPIYKEEMIIGTLHKIYKADVFSEGFTISLFNNRGYINIINDAGEVIIRSAEEGIDAINNNYYRELYLLDNASQAETIKHELEIEGSGFVELQLFENKSFAAYTKIDEVYGWSLISAVPSEVISRNANVVEKVIILILAVFSVVVVGAYGCIFISTLRRKRVVEIMAFKDRLTGGHTYNKILVTAPQLLNENPDSSYVFVYLDVDNFKYINNMHGYEYGDFLIKSIYKSFQDMLSEKEILARISADHYIALLNRTDIKEVEQYINDIVTQVQDIAGIFFTVSCGVYVVNEKNENLQLMIDKAAIAAKTVKGRTKEVLALYTPNMSEPAKKEEEIRQDMQRALNNNEFEPFYQPKVNVYNSEIEGAEVLVRWRHPVKGLISPDKFIPIFEKTGFIIDVDLYMFECVCKKIRKYIDQGIPVIPISVNFSRVHLYHHSFIGKIKELIKQYDILPKYVELELTESAMFDNLEIINTILSELQSFGFVISMDDFGSGYSSLNMLKEIPINVLKIDREFFMGNSDKERREMVIESIVELAHKLNINVVAEGIETIEQVEFLKQIGCSIAQGFYYSRPLPSDEFDTLYQKIV